jgi:tRNA nucleotidyltransferase (CCA-adding enzyme)
MDEVLKKRILSLVMPTAEENTEFVKVAEKLVRKIKKIANKLDIKCSPYIGGSFGKGTYLKGNSDVDIFMRFDKSYNDSDLSKFLEKILIDSKIKYKKQKGSRDYFSGKFGPKEFRIEFEFVPNRFVIKKSEAVNSTDLSPLHVEFLKLKEKMDSSLTDEIRLAKQFFKAQDLYGAESYIGGFSGHVIDILIMTFGSLDKLIENGKTWESQMYIDINKVYKDFHEAALALGDDKNSSLVIIDPIISNRNAARALSEENYSRFLLVCNRMGSLDESDFTIVKKDFTEIMDSHKLFCKTNNLKLVMYKITFSVKGESEDIVGSKLKKLHGKLFKYFDSLDFRIFNDEFFVDIKGGVCLFCFDFEKITLPSVKVLKGPKTFMTDAIVSFLKGRDSQYFIREDRICIYDKRRITDLNEVINFDKEELQKMLFKNIDFVKTVRVKKF